MLIAALMLTAMPAPDPSQDVKDTRCVAALLAFSEGASSKGASAEDKEALSGAMMFYVGKLAGRHSQAEVLALLNSVEKDLAGVDLTAIGTDCSKDMVAFGRVLQGH
jgi:hypothetical protein